MMTRILIAASVALALALALAVGVQSWRLERVKTENHDLKQAAKAWEGYRAAAESDAQTAADQCSERVAEARRSARRINDLIERPVHVDPQGCAVRSLLPSDELRGALTPAPDPAAEPVHDR